MYVRDIMTTNVVTIPSYTTIAEVKRIMAARGFRRLPVVDRGKLVGIVTERQLERVSPSMASSHAASAHGYLNVWELGYLMNNLGVKEVMSQDLVTVSPDMTVEEALALAQKRRVGALLVVEDGRLVGIATTNDYFYRIVNPTLGIGEPGTRVEVIGGGEAKALEEIISLINKLCLKMTNLHISTVPATAWKDVVIHVDCEDVNELVAELGKKGYKVSVRRR